jgi:hypothetical protein
MKDIKNESVILENGLMMKWEKQIVSKPCQNDFQK